MVFQNNHGEQPPLPPIFNRRESNCCISAIWASHWHDDEGSSLLLSSRPPQSAGNTSSVNVFPGFSKAHDVPNYLNWTYPMAFNGTKDPMWFKQKISPKFEGSAIFCQADKTRKTTGAFFQASLFGLPASSPFHPNTNLMKVKSIQ